MEPASLHTVENDKDSFPKRLTVVNVPLFSLKTIMIKQNLQSWFLDMSLPSPQVASLLNKAAFLFQPTLVSRVLAFKLRAAKPEFGDKKIMN